MKYATGEIILVVVGILIALQVNNWNEKRKQKERFQVTLEQIYTSIKEDADLTKGFQFFIQEQIDWIDQILAQPESFNPHQLIYILFYLDTWPRPYSSETDFYLNVLEFNTNDPQQNELAKEIANYMNNLAWDYDENNISQEIAITPLLTAKNVVAPPSIFAYSALSHFNAVDTTFFEEEDILAVQSLLKTRTFRKRLKSLRTMKNMLNISTFGNQIMDSYSILEAIRNYDPNTRLRFDDVGILGTAVASGWERSEPMEQTNPQESIWELDIHLNDGQVKFRTRDSWNQNWGGESFPNGNTIMFGPGILVEEGNYHITLNLSQNTYEFIKKEK